MREGKSGGVLGLIRNFKVIPFSFSLTFVYQKISFDLHFANDFFFLSLLMAL